MRSDPLQWTANVRCTVIRPSGLRVVVFEAHNLIVDAGLDVLRNALDSTREHTTSIGWVAIGTDNTAPTSGDTALISEVFRKRVASQDPGGTGVLDTTTLIAPDEANGFATIQEIGWFTSDGTSAADSGTLIARVNGVGFDKNASESFQIDRTDTFTVA